MTAVRRWRLRGRAVWTGVDAKPLTDVEVLVAGDRIAGVVPRGASPMDEGIGETVLDLGDAVMLPGLIDAHLHLLGGAAAATTVPAEWSDAYRALGAIEDLKCLLRAGFTTVRCMGSPIGPALQQASVEGLVDGPRIVAAGHYICQSGGTWDPPYRSGTWPDPSVMRADGVDECRRRVRERVRGQSGVVKVGVSSGRPDVDLVHPWADSADASRANYTAEELRAVVEEAHSAGLKVAAHAIGEAAVRKAVLAGVDSVEHGHGATEETYELMAERGVFLIPTLALPAMRARFGREKGLAPPIVDIWKKHSDQQMASVALALRSGVSIAVGTDFLGPPYTPMGKNACEFQLLVEAGLTAQQALVAGTSNAAEVLGLACDVGTLTIGKRADIIAVRGSPWDDPVILQYVDFVMRGGHLVKPVTQEIAPELLD